MRTEFDANQEILRQLLTLLLSVSAWPSRPLRDRELPQMVCFAALDNRFVSHSANAESRRGFWVFLLGALHFPTRTG